MDHGTDVIMPMDDLQVEIASIQGYHDHSLAWQACTSRLIQKACKSTSVQGKFKFTQVIRQTISYVADRKTSQRHEFWSQYKTVIHNSDVLCKWEKLSDWNINKSANRTSSEPINKIQYPSEKVALRAYIELHTANGVYHTGYIVQVQT